MNSEPLKRWLTSPGMGMFVVVALVVVFGFGVAGFTPDVSSVRAISQNAAMAPDISYSQQRVALYSAARVYGKAGCGDFALAEATVRYALRAGVPAEIVAAKVAVESSCNPLAVSHKGAVGLTQVMPSIWRGKYDFAAVNLFNPEDSLRVGTEILSGLIAKHGARGGLRRYNGAGPEAEAYADRVLALAAAGKKK